MSLVDGIQRKALHLSAIVYALMYAVLPRNFALAGMVLIGAGLVAMDYKRLHDQGFALDLERRLGLLAHPEDGNRMGSVVWSWIGCAITMVVFADRAIVLAALGFFILGDAAATIVGRKWGRHPVPYNPRKTVEGAAAFAVVSFVWAAALLPLPVSFLAACSAAAVESIELPGNENLWIPLLSGTVLSVFNLLL